MKAKKALGQHFLNDLEMAIAIVDSLFEEPKNVLEIGPGPGVLTQFLYEKRDQYNLKFAELDRNFCKSLKEQYPEVADDIEEGDVLHQNWNTLFDSPFQVIGNFPYNISSQIVFKVIEHKDQVPIMVGMFQKEMAERICSPHGKKSFGVITVLTQFYYHAKILFNLPPSSFSPPPKVNSSVILLERKKETPDIEYAILRRLVKKAFSQRRKKLRNALSGERVLEMPIFVDFADKRAEQLSVEDFIKLAKANIENE